MPSLAMYESEPPVSPDMTRVGEPPAECSAAWIPREDSRRHGLLSLR